MKQKMILAFLLGFSGVAANAATFQSQDCHVYAYQLRYAQGGWLGTWSWGTYDILLDKTMTLRDPNGFTYENQAMQIVASLRVDGDRASVQFRAPSVGKSEFVPVKYGEDGVGTVSFHAERKNYATREGTSYDISCSLGLNSLVDGIKANDEAEMNRLGPAANWEDPTAPSLSQLPVGTVLELTKDLAINPGSDRATTYFVEQNGLLTLAQFNALRLQFRFAFAEFYNANNGYINPAFYPRGTQIRVEGITRHDFTSGGHEYYLTFRTLTGGVNDPITTMKVDGRRSGRSEITIPQFVQLIAPAFKIVDGNAR